MSGDPIDLDAITDDAERAQRFLRDVRLDPTTTLALVAELRRLRASRRPRAYLCNDGDNHRQPCDCARTRAAAR